MKNYYIYIMANDKPSLYIGVTGDLVRRVYEHRQHTLKGFTDQYNCDKLVYFESTDSAEYALNREKQLKRWRRQWKLNLIEENNPKFQDLYPALVSEDTETSSV